MLPLKIGKKETENRREESFSPVKPFSTTRNYLRAALFFYGGWFFSNRLLSDPRLYYSPFFRAIAWLLFLSGIVLALTTLTGRMRGRATLLALLLLVFHVRIMVVDVVRVDGPSMSPALQNGDIIVVERLSTGLHLPALDFPFSLLQDSDPGPPWSRTLFARPPAKGDIIVFDFPEGREGRYYIKRVAALPHQTYRFSDQMLLIDGEPLRTPSGEIARIEPYPERHQNPVTDPPRRFEHLDPVFLYASLQGIGTSGQVPAEGLLVLGDAFTESRDSRTIGFIPISAVQGRRWGNFVF